MLGVFAVMLSVCCLASVVQAAPIDLATHLSNGGFEDDDSDPHTCSNMAPEAAACVPWTVTSPSSNFTFDAPAVNPVIYPNSPLGLEPPPGGGHNFVGILNPVHNDVAGRLVQMVTRAF